MERPIFKPVGTPVEQLDTPALVVDLAILERNINTLHGFFRQHDATVPHHTGKPLQHPTARWVFQYFVGIHLLLTPGQWPLVLNLTEEHQHLLRLLGKPYERFYS